MIGKCSDALSVLFGCVVNIAQIYSQLCSDVQSVPYRCTVNPVESYSWCTGVDMAIQAGIHPTLEQSTQSRHDAWLQVNEYAPDESRSRGEPRWRTTTRPPKPAPQCTAISCAISGINGYAMRYCQDVIVTKVDCYMTQSYSVHCYEF